MSFVWYTNHSRNSDATVSFYADLLGWTPAPEGPPGMTIFANAEGPFAGVEDVKESDPAWLPFAQVDDVNIATEKAQSLGATLVKPVVRGPAGFYSVLSDPGGATFALWQRA